MTESSKPVVLVDGSSYLFRAFHALPPLVNSAGMQTGAIKGVVNMLRSLVKMYPQSPITVVFDAKGPTFRNDMYSEYKANRPPMAEELREQIEPIHECVRAMGLPLLCIPGVEADDVIGTLADQATKAGQDCVVSTGDKDMAQLVSAHVTLLNTMKNNEILDIPAVEKKYGFGPDRMIDYLALMGDKVDNIPGVPGVGEKTALALIQGLGGLDNIYANLDQVATLTFRGAKTMAAKLEANKEMAYLSYELATIKLDVELETSLQELKPLPADEARLLELFQQFEFKTWIRELTGEAPAKNEKPATKKAQAEAQTQEIVEPDSIDYQVITEMSGLANVIADIAQSKHMAFLPVLDKGHYLQPKWAGLALASAPGKAWYIAFQSDGLPVLEPALVFDQLAPLFAEHDIEKTGYDIKADYHWLSSLNMDTARMLNDVQVMAFVYDSTIKRDKSLSAHFSHLSIDNLIIAYLNKNPKTIEDFLGKTGKRQLEAGAVQAEEFGMWWAERVDLTLRLGQWFKAGLASRSLTSVYEKIERPLSRTLANIEENGVVLDTDFIHDLSARLKARLADIEQQAHALAETEFNLDSPKQLAEILFEKMALPVISKTASGAPSTNEEVLTELAQSHELPKLILQSRHLRKLVGTYTDPLPTMLKAHEGSEARLHTTYNQTGAQTGRLNSNDPNLQNIPIRTEEGRSIRKAFVAPKGYKIVAADYSQIELRIMTHLSQDENLIKAFKEGKDIHRATAADVMGIAEADVSSEQRRSAKAINFGLIYGMSAFGLAKQLGISRTEAKNYVDAYFERYPGVRRYMDETRADAAETGYVETVFGRRLYLPGIQSSNQIARKAAERTAINAPMQGTAADIIKMAMVDVDNWLISSSLQAKMIMQVHDELVFEVHEDDVDALIDGVRFRMQHCANLDVPLIVDVDTGDSWEEAH